ncbi:MAG: c-type cytochrome [Leptospirales bacterium]
MKTGEKVVFLLAGLMVLSAMVLYVLARLHVVTFWTTNDVYLFSKKSAAGYEVFEKYSCRDCHVVYGEGDYDGPDMDGEGTRRTAAWLHSYLNDPGSLVPGTAHSGKFAPTFDKISPEEKDKLVDLMMSLKALPGSPNYPKPPK